MDITVPPEVAELARRTREFIAEVVIPVEEQTAGSIHAAPDELRRSLQKQAAAAGLLAPHVPVEWGGCGLDVRGQAVVFEEAGYSLLGPLALNCAAPDEGNMHLLEVVATPGAEGEVPAPAGGGRDPVLLRDDRARARGRGRPVDAVDHRDPGRRRVAHRRAQVVHQRRARRGLRDLHGPDQRDAGRTRRRDDVPGRRGTIRACAWSGDIDTLDEGLFGGHSEVLFEDCAVGPWSVLGEVDRRVRVRPGAARAGPADALHAVAGPGAAGARHRGGLGRDP